MESDLQEIAIANSILESTAKKAVAWLVRQRSNWLVIFDNADDTASEIHKYLPDSAFGNILITTRSWKLSSFAPQSSFEVGDMESAEALYLFSKFYPPVLDKKFEVGNELLKVNHFT